MAGRPMNLWRVWIGQLYKTLYYKCAHFRTFSANMCIVHDQTFDSVSDSHFDSLDGMDRFCVKLSVFGAPI